MGSARSLFSGSYALKVDAKGRIAMPADMRRMLNLEEMNGFYCVPSIMGSNLDCGGPDLLDRTYALIERLDPYDPDRADLTEALISRSWPIFFDGDGRFILPQHLRAFARIEDRVVMLGFGATFQIRRGEADEVITPDSTIERARRALGKLKSPAMSVAGGAK
jgi:MraZ protein